MSARVLWRPRAHQDLANTARYLGDRSASTALHFLESVQNATELLQNHPFAGAVAPGVSAGASEYRRWAIPGFRSYLLFYIATSGEVEIVRLLHGSRDLTPDLLGEEPENE